MKSLSLAALLILMIGCSESTDFYAKSREKSALPQSNSEATVPTPIIATPDQLVGLPLVADEGLVIVTDGPEKPGSFEITNIDPDNSYDTKNIRTIIYPIRGLVQRPVTVVDSKTEIIPTTITITTLSGQPIQDFGTTIIGKQVDSKIIITNTSKEPIKIDLRFKKDESFRIQDSKECPEILKTDESCTIVVILDAKTSGTHQDQLIIEHGSLKRDERERTKISVIAVKVEDLETCGDKPCGKPFKEGTLISSEVFSNDIDFGPISIGTVVKKQVEIQNKGDVALTVKDHKLDDQGVFSFSGGQFPGEKGTCSDILAPGSCVVEIAYRPQEVRSYLGSLTVSSYEGPSVKLNITGFGSSKKSCDTTNEYLVVPEKSYPASKVIFPYLKTVAGTSAELEQLYGMRKNSYAPEIKDDTVKDGMVYITFSLPEMEGEIISMNFGVNVFKVIRDNFKDTESLCLSTQEIRKCSGHEFSLPSWQKLKNPSFWNLFSKPVNDLYEKQLVSGENKCGSKNCLALNTRYELKDIFNLSVKEFQTIRDEGILTLIFSDDTSMLTMPRISVKTKIKKECL